MIELLPKMFLHGNRPSFYDGDSVTILELSAKLHGKMNELVEDYNKFADTINEQFTEFMLVARDDLEAFQISMRQEFQDFIDVIDLKIQDQDQDIENAIKYMKTNLVAVVQEYVEKTLAGSDIKLTTTYNEETGELSFVATTQE